MNKFNPLRVPPSPKPTPQSRPLDAGDPDITQVMHELRNQLCTLSLGIAALKYPEESEELRQRHLAALEGVLHEMTERFHRLDDWLIEVGWKPAPQDPGTADACVDEKNPRPCSDTADGKIVRLHDRLS